MTAAAPAVPRAEARRRANVELGLLVLAVVVVLSAYALVGLSQAPRLPEDLLAYGGALVALAAVAHIVTRRLAPGGDPLLMPLAFALNGLGLVMVRRIDFAFAAREQPPDPLGPAQAVWTVAGIAAFALTLAAVRDHRVLDNYRYLIGAGAIVLLLLPSIPGVGVEVNGAQLWVRLLGFSFQPGELAKLALVAFFASYLADKRQLLTVATNRVGPFMLPPARAFGPISAIWALSLGVLISQRDLGVGLLIFGLFVAMLYVATARPAYIAVAVALFAAGGMFAYSAFSHVQQRITIWLDLWNNLDARGAGQLMQSLFALGTGGLAGVGWGQGRPEFIPVVSTDFIFSAFGEELGLLGATALLLCYLLVVGRGLRIAVRATDEFSALLAAGLTIIFGLQVFIIVGGVTRLLPLTGLTLPFLSYGGSSLLSNWILIALLLRVSAPQPSAAAP